MYIKNYEVNIYIHLKTEMEDYIIFIKKYNHI